MPVGQAQEKPEGRGKQRCEQPPFLEPHLLKPGDERERSLSLDTPPGMLPESYKGSSLLCLIFRCSKQQRLVPGRDEAEGAGVFLGVL